MTYKANGTKLIELGKHRGGNAYITVSIGGVQREILLDTGCDQSLIPASYVEGYELMPTGARVTAANDTPIKIVGRTQVVIELGPLHFKSWVLVSDMISEGMLGLDWIEQVCPTWDFERHRFSVGEYSFPLGHRAPRQKCCRVAVAADLCPVAELRKGSATRMTGGKRGKFDMEIGPDDDCGAMWRQGDRLKPGGLLWQGSSMGRSEIRTQRTRVLWVG